MDALLADLARRFRFNENVLAAATGGFAAEDWSSAPGAQGGNTPHWILGHLASTRRYLARRLGVDLLEEPWEALFGMRSKPAGTRGYPPPEALVQDFASTGERMCARLAELSPAQAGEDWGGSFPDGSRTLAGAAGFLHFHESYHLGQLGLARRLRGHPGFA